MTGRSRLVSFTFPRQITRDHGFSHERIIALIKNSLDAIITDPIPTSIRIYNIAIIQVADNQLEITCEVFFDA